MNESFEMEFTLDKIIFQKNDFKIVRVKSSTQEVRKYLNPTWSNVSIKGEMPMLKPSVRYTCMVNKVEENPPYGYTLSVDTVYPKGFGADDLKTDNDLISFVEIFIGEGTADKLRNTKGILEMVEKGDIKGITSIKGIGERTAEKLMNAYQKEAVGSKYHVKIKKLGFSDNEIKTLKRNYNNNLYMAWEAINHNIFTLGFRLDRMDKIFLEGLEGEPTDKRRLNAYIVKGLKDYMYDGYKSYIPLNAFYNLDMLRNIEQRVGREALEGCVKDLVRKEELKIIEGKYITTFSEWQLENNVKHVIESIIANQNVDMLPIEDIDKEIEEQEEIIGFKLNEGQRKAVKDILMSDKALCMLNGFAGTGKTSVTKVILNIYTKYGLGDFKLCALSGRASSILGESSGYPQFANTIHRTLGVNMESGGWGYTRDNKFSLTSVLVIDEISMIDFYLLYSILSPVAPNMKVILLGDSGQLPSLSFGKTIETLRLFENGVQINELTQIMRQSEDAYISKVANDVRTNVNPFDNTKYKWYGEDVEVCIGDSYNYMLDSFINKYKEDRESSIVVTTTKAKTDMINFDIQARLIKEKLIDDKSPYIVKPSNTKGKVYKMYIGDSVMVLKNNYQSKDFTDRKLEEFLIEEEGEVEYKIVTQPTPIFNGEIYTVKEIYDDYTVLTDKYGDVIVETEELECCLAYASNCHKMQGSGLPNIFVYHTSDWVDTNMMVSAQWVYTAFTRAKKFLSIHTDKYSNISKGARTNAIDKKVTIIELLMK